ncbi:MAG: hypothetical protein MUE69_34790 [Myxococcota bacterium]|nr:hypothetical protein [Myxococcota bacterium]
MAQFEFKLPDIGEGVSEGEIVEWHVKVGDVVAEDDAMVEVMTDKATVTIGAPRAGTISDIRFKAGEVAQVGQVIVTIAVGAAAEEGRGPGRDRGGRHPRRPAGQQLLPDQAERRGAQRQRTAWEPGRGRQARGRRSAGDRVLPGQAARDPRDAQARA